jgi:3-dehydroquinate dehydratase/shikimate dehydrogenase
MTYLTVPISAKNVNEASTQIECACSAGAEMLELRMDYLTELTTSAVKTLLAQIHARHLPAIVTCRDTAEGGNGSWPLDMRLSILLEAIACGADFIDCEFANFTDHAVADTLFKALKDSSTRLILSAHNFDGPFDDAWQLYEDMLAACEHAIPKIVYHADNINDCFDAFDMLCQRKGDLIAICMGPAGFISRILAKKLGALVTFASIDDAAATAPGQVTIDQMKNLYRWDSIDEDTAIYGVIGDPIAHSMSPALFNALFDAHQINALFLPLLVQGQRPGFDAFMDNARTATYLDMHGFSVTLPHKAHALDYVEKNGEHIESLAADIGAVNTLKLGSSGKIGAYNTDYAGARDALVSTMGIDKHDLHKKTVAVIGAGGVARAVVAGLADVGADVTIYNRTVEKAKALAEEFKCKFASIEDVPNLKAEIVVNCTSIGMHPNVDNSPIPAECFNSSMAAFDTVYNPVKTKMLTFAENAGAKTISGDEMFIRQAMAQFKIYTGQTPNEQVMRKTVAARLA